MAQADIKYYYQFFKWSRKIKPKQALYTDWEVFLHSIRLIKIDTQEDNPQQRLRGYPDFVKNNLTLLEDFATHILGNIYWYERKRVKEETIRLAYILVSLALLLLVPILVAYLQKEYKSVPGSVTAIFTGFFALYQGASKWLQSRNVIRTVWQTSGNLRSRLYSLEDKWTYRNPTGKNWKQDDLFELEMDLRKAVRFGLESQKVEKQLFFDNYSYPQFNILSSIIGVRGQVRELFRRDEPLSQSPRSAHPTSNAQMKLAKLTEIADEPAIERTDTSELGFPALGETPKAPKIIDREAWGSRPPKNAPTPLGETISIIIHHAAGYWDGKTPGKRQIQRIQQLHQDDRGWRDIGYHFLVDPLGNIYQGREFMDQTHSLGDIPVLVSGAHVGGFNTGRIGICLLGNYETGSARTTHKPTVKSQLAIIQLVAYLIDRYQPTGDPEREGEIILGHKDLKSTSCPGKELYEWLDELRESVKD